MADVEQPPPEPAAEAPPAEGPPAEDAPPSADAGGDGTGPVTGGKVRLMPLDYKAPKSDQKDFFVCIGIVFGLALICGIAVLILHYGFLSGSDDKLLHKENYGTIGKKKN